MNLNDAWASIYATLPDNAFDYVGKPFYMQDGSIQLWDGIEMVSYYPAPF